MSVSVISEILGLFVNTLLMTSILLVIVRIYCKQFKCNDLRNKIFFLNYLPYLWNIPQVFNSLKNKLTFIADAFPKLQIAKDVVS